MDSFIQQIFAEHRDVQGKVPSTRDIAVSTNDVISAPPTEVPRLTRIMVRKGKPQPMTVGVNEGGEPECGLLKLQERTLSCGGDLGKPFGMGRRLWT